MKTGRQILTLSGHHFHIVGFYLDGKYAVSGSLDGSLRVWDVASSRALSVINVGSSSEPMFGLTRISRTRFIGSFPSGIMKMWDVSSVLASDQQDNYPVMRQCVGPGDFYIYSLPATRTCRSSHGMTVIQTCKQVALPSLRASAQKTRRQ